MSIHSRHFHQVYHDFDMNESNVGMKKMRFSLDLKAVNVPTTQMKSGNVFHSLEPKIALI